MPDFFQPPPELANAYSDGSFIRDNLREKLPGEIFEQIDPELRAFGRECATRLDGLARQAEREPPRVAAYDAWGHRVDRLQFSPAWWALRDASAREGLVAIAYERKHAEYARLHQFAKLFLFHPASAFYSCPIAMTDGAARILELSGDHPDVLQHLLSRDPSSFWTSGQWMTERTGGSDVSDTSTVAEKQGEAWALRGAKHFTSAAESQIALALARKPGAVAGARGLTLFMAQPRDPSGEWNGVLVRQLKDKLGTRALATAELDLVACPAVQIGRDGEGVRTVAAMLNVTRLHNSICALGEASRALASLEDYAGKRIVFGRPLAAQPLHQQLIGRLRADLDAGLILTLELAHLLGRDETGVATAQERTILRVMTPVCKLTTAKIALAIASEVVEGFGGAGYIEDIGVARHLRDAQVFSIWEGPTHVLALDMLRAMRPDGAAPALLDDLARRTACLHSSRCDALRAHADRLKESLPALLTRAASEQEWAARDLAFHLAGLYAAALMLPHAPADRLAALVARIPSFF